MPLEVLTFYRYLHLEIEVDKRRDAISNDFPANSLIFPDKSWLGKYIRQKCAFVYRG